jgi:hypothetical protein
MKLSSGSEVVVDLTKISIKEWREMWKTETEDDVSDELVARIVGMTIDELRGLNFRDFQRVAMAIRKAALNPLDDEKNLASAST